MVAVEEPRESALSGSGVPRNDVTLGDDADDLVMLNHGDGRDAPFHHQSGRLLQHVSGETVATGADMISSTRLPPRGLTLVATEPTTAAMSSVEITPTGRSDPGSTTTR